MKDTAFFERALGLEHPWYVKDVRMDLGKKRVEIEVGCRAVAWADPETRERAHVHGMEKRTWRHLDTMQFETVIEAEVPRVKYGDGRTEMVAVPWAERYSRFTKDFEEWAVAVTESCATLRDACVLLGLNWGSAHAIMKRAVDRGLGRRADRGVAYVGLDEKSFRRGQSYISVLSDIGGGRVLDVVEGRDAESAGKLLDRLAPPQKEALKAVAIDMSAAFRAAVLGRLPEADIVYDRFHVSKILNAAVDEVRRKENAQLIAGNDVRLKGTRYQWLFNPANLDDDRLEDLAELAKRNLRTSRAWMHKENFVGFWSQEGRWAGERYLKEWYKSVIHSRLDPIKRAARTLKAHADGLLNYFIHPITNAVAEGLNSRIQSLKSAARGFRNFENYRIRILFFCGKLDMSPPS